MPSYENPCLDCGRDEGPGYVCTLRHLLGKIKSMKGHRICRWHLTIYMDGEQGDTLLTLLWEDLRGERMDEELFAASSLGHSKQRGLLGYYLVMRFILSVVSVVQ